MNKSRAIVIVRSGNEWYHDIVLNYTQLSIDYGVSSNYGSINFDYFIVDDFVKNDFSHYDTIIIIKAGCLILLGTIQFDIMPFINDFEWIEVNNEINVWQPKGNGQQKIYVRREPSYICSDTQYNFLLSHTNIVKEIIDDSNMSYIVHNEIPIMGNKSKKDLDYVVTVSSGFFVNCILDFHGYHDQTEIHHIDISKPSLQIRKYTIENWEGDNLDQWIEHLNKKFPTIKLFNKNHFTKDDFMWLGVWQNLQEQFGDRWKSHWDSYKNLNHIYHRINIASEKDVNGVLEKLPHGQGAIWWNGSLKRLPGNIMKDSNGSWESAKSFLNNLRLKSPNLICYGSDHCTQQYNGLTSIQCLDEISSTNSRNDLWKISNAKQIIREDIKPGPVGLFLSGGADSAVLLYLLAEAEKDLVILTIDRDGRRHQLPHAKKVIAWIQKRFPKVNILQHFIVDIPSGTDNSEIQNIKENTIKKLQEEYNFDTWTNAMTLNPKITLTNNHERDVPRDKDFPKWNGNKLRPFHNIDKLSIMHLYHKLDIIDLFDCTISCEVSDPPCNDCWWCQERTWAIEEYGLSTNTTK